jgi:hypothetical protein
MEEIDIWRSAALLVRQHGEDADLHAARHMDAMIERGDPQGEAVWRRIMRPVTELQTTAPPRGGKLR